MEKAKRVKRQLKMRPKKKKTITLENEHKISLHDPYIPL